MDTLALAPGYRSVVTALRVFRARVPDAAGVQPARDRASTWIGSQRLPVSGVAKQEETPGWRTFKSSEHPPSHLFYVHGGGLVFYSVEDFSSLMEHFAVAADCEVTAFHYPKAPESTADEILNVIAAQVQRRLSQIAPGSPIVFAGDSIGGYLALCLAVRRFPKRFARAVLIYPVLDLYAERSSYVTYGHGYCLNAEMMRWFRSFWRSQQGTGDEFLPFSLTASDCENLPPVVVVSAEADVLRDEAFDWCESLRTRGLPVEHHHMPNLAHDFCLYAGKIAEARTAVDLIAGQFRAQDRQ